MRRRVELAFTDGSRIVLAVPRFGTLSPARIVAALQDQATDGPDQSRPSVPG